MGITNRQAEISGEILASVLLDNVSEQGLTLSASYQSIANYKVGFTSDRTGNAELEMLIYIAKTESGQNVAINCRLLDADDNIISNTERELIYLPQDEVRGYCQLIWKMPITANSNYMYQVQFKSLNTNNRTIVKYGGFSGAALLKVTGL